jgi:hypothetical protein
VLWNRNDFLRFWFRFLLLKSYGSGSDFWKSYVSGSGSYYWKVTVLVPYRFQLHIWTIRSNFFKKYFGIFFAFLPGKLFDKEKVYKFQQIYCEMWMKIFFLMKVIKYIMLNLLNLVPVPVPLVKKLWFLQFRFRFHNTAFCFSKHILLLSLDTTSVADPDPGSGMGFFRIPDLGSRIPRPYFEELFHNFFVKSSIVLWKLAQIFFP